VPPPFAAAAARRKRPSSNGFAIERRVRPLRRPHACLKGLGFRAFCERSALEKIIAGRP
jgi:hypothetical protein